MQNRSTLNGNQPFVYLLIYDAVTQRTTLQIADSPIPSQAKQIVNTILLTTFEELNYYYNALIENIGTNNVSIIWKQDLVTLKMRYIYIGMGLKGSVIGTDGLPTASNANMIQFDASFAIIGVEVSTANDSNNPVFANISNSVFLPKDSLNQYNFYGSILDQNGGYSLTCFDSAGNIIQSNYNIGRIATNVMVPAATKRIFFDRRSCLITCTTTDAFAFAGYSSINLQDVHGVVDAPYNCISTTTLYLACATNKDIRLYQNGVLVQTLLAVLPNTSSFISVPAQNFDNIKIVDAGSAAPPTPPVTSTVTYSYQRGTLNSSFEIDQNGTPVAQNNPGDLYTTGSFDVAAADVILTTGTTGDSSLVALKITNTTDNITLVDNSAAGTNSFSFNVVAGKSYSIRITNIGSPNT